MNIDELVNQVTKTVYQQLLENEKQKAIEEASLSAVIVSCLPKPKLEKRIPSNYRIQYYCEQTEEADLVILPSMSISMMANLASCICQTPEERYLLSMLLKGKRIVSLKDGMEYRSYKATSPVILYKMYEEFEMKLTGFGMEFCDFDSLCLLEKKAEEVPDGKLEQIPSQEPEETEAILIDKKLISEADLQKIFLKHKRTIVVQPKAIFTPLAKDYIRTNKIVIKNGL